MQISNKLRNDKKKHSFENYIFYRKRFNFLIFVGIWIRNYFFRKWIPWSGSTSKWSVSETLVTLYIGPIKDPVWILFQYLAFINLILIWTSVLAMISLKLSEYSIFGRKTQVIINNLISFVFEWITGVCECIWIIILILWIAEENAFDLI